MKAQAQSELLEKLSLVKSGANIFGGGVWNPRNDLNWAFQEIKLEKARPEYKEKAEAMLRKYVPSLSPSEAGQLIQTIHALTYQCVSELMNQGVQVVDARKAIFALIKEKIGTPDR